MALLQRIGLGREQQGRVLALAGPSGAVEPSRMSSPMRVSRKRVGGTEQYDSPDGP